MMIIRSKWIDITRDVSTLLYLLVCCGIRWEQRFSLTLAVLLTSTMHVISDHAYFSFCLTHLIAGHTSWKGSHSYIYIYMLNVKDEKNTTNKQQQQSLRTQFHTVYRTTLTTTHCANRIDTRPDYRQILGHCIHKCAVAKTAHRRTDVYMLHCILTRSTHAHTLYVNHSNRKLACHSGRKRTNEIK